MADQVHVRSEHNASGFNTVSTAVLSPEGTLQVTARFAVIYGGDQVIGYQCLVIEARLNGALVTDPTRAKRLAARAGIREPPMMTWVDGPAVRQDEEMTHMTEVDHDLTLLGLAERVRQFTGHIEDMGDDERVFLLGQFAGATSRLRARVRELYAKAGDDSYMDALPPLHQVMLALGAPEDWAEGTVRGD